MTAFAHQYSIAEQEALAWLRKWDKHLWGINASYIAAAKMLGDKCISARRISDLLFDTSISEKVDDAGEVKKVTTRDWYGHLLFWKCPDMYYGPRSPTKEVSLTKAQWSNMYYGPRSPTKEVSLTKAQWSRLKVFVEQKRKILHEPDTTVAFVIRLLRYNRLPANNHIVSELFTLKHIPMRETPE